ncbi:MAG: methyl-accepting chemotaxis protein [Desulfomonile sp.]|nr:methyl-accepting chemotaxis protein [Desulfomonile sp.]
MRNVITESLMGKLVAGFVLVALLPTAVAGYLFLNGPSVLSHKAHSLTLYLVVVGLVIAAIAALGAFVMARSIAKPLREVADRVDGIVRQGDFAFTMSPGKRKDEIGRLIGSFGKLVETIRSQVGRTVEAVNIMAVSAADISSTVAQLGVGTSKTSSAVAETTTTVEEVRQAAKVSSTQAKGVADTARKAVAFSESGKKATEDTVYRMNLIRDQMESIGETVVKLSEHSRTIEEIIVAVQDIADQSNLLAVNASIEAARAGDQGKGFAVVAQEIKTLADQSRELTQQVRSILDETRKWVGAVVMATEQGGKAVDAGLEQSVRTGEAIQALTDSVSEAAHAASVIDASSSQQFVGVDQVASAMTSIEQAMQQNLAGTAQLEAAARRLEELAGMLKQSLARFTT